MGLRGKGDENLGEGGRESAETIFCTEDIWKCVWTWVLGLEASFRGQNTKLGTTQEEESNKTLSPLERLEDTETSMGYTFNLSVN